MIVDDQKDMIALMSDPATFGTTDPVEQIETHISRIFLAGDRVYKTKRAVDLPYADFSTPGLRYAACEKEMELNRLTAPGLYLGVHRITREPAGSLALDGEGEMIDAAVEMARFGQDCLLDAMAVAGKLTPELMTDVARMIARFHRAAPVVHDGGGMANLAGVLNINEAGFATSHVFTETETAQFNAQFRQRLAAHADLLDRREAAGRIRRCHGDLHLRNICMLDDRPHLFDCIEFNDQIASVDVLYDLAFLLMDLWHRGFPELANLVTNRYLDESEDEDGFILLPFFMAVRAAVRAHVTATQIEEGGDAGLEAEARSYFDLARALLAGNPPRLVAIGGLSGSGKTTVAEALAAHIGPAPGARIVESDRIRKAMHGASPETHLPETAYRPEVSERVYAAMTRATASTLMAGGAVVTNAVFDRPPDRLRIEMVAVDQAVPFTGIWLAANPSVLRQRVGARQGGSSDATVDVLARQLDHNGEASVDWCTIDTDRPVSAVIKAILDRIANASG